MIVTDWLRSVRPAFPFRHRRHATRRLRKRRQRGERILSAVERLEDRTLLAAPVAVDDEAVVEQNSSSLQVFVLSNDSDADSDPLDITAAGPAANGSVTIAGTTGNEYLCYQPNSGYSGTDTFSYTISDGNGGTDSADVTVTVHAADDMLSNARNVSLTVGVKEQERGFIGDGAYSNGDVDMFRVDLTAGQRLIVDIDADELDDGTELSDLDSYLIVFDDMGMALASNDDADDPDTGTHHLDAALEFTAGWTAPFYIGVSSHDNTAYQPWTPGSGSGSSTGEYRLQLTILPSQPPVANNDGYTVAQDESIDTMMDMLPGVLGNDTDPDSSSLTAALVDDVDYGMLFLNQDGSFTYSPNMGYTGTDTFTYRAYDGSSYSNIATVTIEVGQPGGGQPPVAVDDGYYVELDSTNAVLEMLRNDSDPEAAVLNIDSVTTPLAGAATVQHGTSDTVLYTPNAAYTGADSFSYTISDPAALTDTANVTFTVHAADDTLAAARSLSLTAGVEIESGGIIGDGTLGSQDVDLFSVNLQAGQIVTVDVDAALLDTAASYSGLDGYLRIFDGSGVQLASSDNANDPDTGNFLVDPAKAFIAPSTGTYYIGVSGAGNSSYDSTVAGSGFAGSTGAYRLQALLQDNAAPVAVDDSASTDESTSVTIDVLANDSDPDEDALTIVSVGTPSNGMAYSFYNSSLGRYEINYSPQFGYTGSDSFTYTIQDEHGVQDTATVSVTVGIPNVVAYPDSYEAVNDAPLVVSAADGVLANDTDLENDPLFATKISDPANGTLTLGSDGAFTYTPNATFVGSDSFTYKADDGTNESEIVTVTIEVYDEAIVANDDAYSVGHDATFSVAAPGLLANDWNLGNDPLAAELVAGVSFGTLSLLADGSFTYTPNAGFLGADSFTYRVTDGPETSSPATVTLQVTNIAPRGTDDFYRLSHDTTLTATSVLANDGDFENDPLTAAPVSGPANGTLLLQSDGTFTYTPNAGFEGTDTFTYRPDDGLTLGSLVTVTLTVANESPTARDDRFGTPANQPLTVLAADGLLLNDGDPEGDPLAAFLDAAPANGTLTFGGDGSFTYIPATDFSGSDTFTYHVRDGVNDSPSATVTIVVGADPPQTTADYFTVSHDRPLTVNAAAGVLSNDVAGGATVTAAVVAQPATGTLSLSPDGSFTYTPNAAFVGTDTFTYQATDVFGASRETTVTIDVTNEAPAARPLSYATRPDELLTVDAATGVLSNDSDLDGDALAAVVSATTTNGTLTLSADGSFTYTPNAGFVGDDIFTYTADDGLGPGEPATVTISVGNTAPVAVGETYSVQHGQMLTVATAEGLLLNDFDADGDSLSVTIDVNPAHGTLSLNPADGTFTYTPQAGFSGIDSFTYHVSDGYENSETVTAEIQVTNLAPWATHYEFAVIRGTPLYVAAPGVLEFAGDPDGDPLAISVTDNVDSGTLVVQADGSLTYTPNAGFTGNDAAELQFSDGAGGTAVSTVTFSVTDTAPVAGGDSYAVSHGQTLAVNAAAGVLANDTDDDGHPLTVSVVAGSGVQNGTLTLSSDGSFSYTPNAGFLGSDSFTYRVSDGALTDDATVTIQAVNNVPFAVNDLYGVLIDETLTIAAAAGILANDSDLDGDPLTIELVDAVANGTLTLNADGSFTYTPDAGFIGVDRFTYQLKDGVYDPALYDPQIPELDGYVRSNRVQVELHVYDVELAAEPEAYQSPHDQPLSGNVRDNDFNWTGTAVTAEKTSDPVNGTVTLNADGTFTYTPTAGFVGQDSWSYKLKRDDLTLETSPVTVTIDVVNTAPVAVGRSFSVSHGQTLSVSAADGLVAAASDAEQDGLTAAVVASPANGTLTLNPDGSFDYTPTVATYLGTDTFTYRVSDGLADSATVTVTIEMTNAAPAARADFFATRIGTPLVVLLAADGVLANDFDDDGDPLAAALGTDVAHGVLALNSDGTFTYTPVAGYVGTDSFTYTPGDGISSGTAVTVEILVVNNVPVGLDDDYVGTRGEPLIVDAAFGVLANDADWDGDPLNAAVETGPASGTLSFNPDGSFTYTPNSVSVAGDSFTYRVGDGHTVSDPLTVTISLTNNAPAGYSDQFLTNRNLPLTVAIADLLVNDGDPDGDVLSYVPESLPANGTLTDNGDGTLTYQPGSGFTGVDSWTYRVSDGLTQSDPITVDVEVVNSEPVAWDDSFTVDHDGTLTVAAGELFRNDFDLNNDPLAAAVDSGPSHGTLSLNPDGSFTYTPQAGYVGPDRFRYVVNDGIDTSLAAVVTISVENSKPVTRPNAHRVVHDTALTVAADDGLLADASDAEDDALTIEVVANVVHGTLSVQSDGSYTYTPEAEFVGSDGFAYRVSDGIGSSDVVTVSIDVDNTLPVAGGDFYTAVKGETLVVTGSGILANDADTDQDPLEITLKNNVRHGSLSLGADGSFTYTPNAGFAGRDQFTYAVSDGVDEAWGTALIDVLGDNDNPQVAPVADDDYYTAAHDTALSVGSGHGVTANDYDPTGDWLTATLVSGPSSGQLQLQDDGSFTYTPTALFVGSDSFTYTVSDGTLTSNTATVHLTVVNSIPVSSNAVWSVHHGQTLTVDDPDSGLSVRAADRDGDSLSFSQVAGPSHGTLSVNNDGTFTYTPTAGYMGTDSFTWRAYDGVAYSAATTVAINVTNTQPFVTGRLFQTQHDQPLTVDGAGLLAAAGDFDGDPLTAALVANASYGNVSLNPDGSFTYTPDAGFAGRDEFEVSVNDGAETSDPAVITIDVLNAVPAAFDTEYTLHQGTPTTVEFPVWDGDGDALVMAFASGGNVQNGTLTFGTVHTWNGSDPATFSGSVTYNPNAGFTGTDTFTFTVTDGVSDPTAGTATVTGTITFTVTNTVPVATGFYQSIRPNQTLSVGAAEGLLSRAWDAESDALQLAAGSVGVFGLQHGQITVNADGSYVYVPNSDPAVAIGTDSFEFTVTDGAGTSESVMLEIQVTNAKPLAFDQTVRYQAQPGPAPVYTFQLNADQRGGLDPDGDPITFALSGGQPSQGTVNVNADGTGTFTAGSSGLVGLVTFQIEVSDGFETSDPKTITLNIGNSAPVAGPDVFTLLYDQSLTITTEDLLSNDFDFDGDSLMVNVDLNSFTESPATPAGTFALVNGDWQYTPAAGFTGTATFTYTVSDGIESSDPVTVTIDVVNSAPWGMDRFYRTLVNQSVALDSLVGDGFAWDLDGDALAVTIVTGPSNGTYSAGVYQPDQDFTGIDTLTFRLFDGVESSDDYQITIEVLPELKLEVDDPVFGTLSVNGAAQFSGPTSALVSPLTAMAPYARNDGVYRVVHDSVLDTSADFAPGLTDNDWTPNGYDPYEPLLLVARDFDGDEVPDGIAEHGTVQVNSYGDFVYTPDPGYVGFDSFWYVIDDSSGLQSNVAVVTIEVTNAAPTAVQQYHRVVFNDETTDPRHSTFISASTFDDDGDPLTYTLLSAPGNGTLTPQTDGNGNLFGWIYEPGDNFTGAASLTYSGTDGFGTATATVEIDVIGYQDNDFVKAFDDVVTWPISGQGGTSFYNDVGVNDPSSTGIDRVLEFSLIAGSGLTLNPDGIFDFTPPDWKQFLENPDGETFTYQATLKDSQTGAVLATDQATLTIKPLFVATGQSISGGQITVHNGSVFGSEQAGTNDIAVWFSGDTVHIIGGNGSGRYSVHVIDTDADPNTQANVVWYGSPGSLDLHADGNIQFDAGGGDFVLSASGDIGTVAGGPLTVQTLSASSSNGSIGDVSVGEEIFYLSAKYNIGNVSAGKSIYTIATTDQSGAIGNVSNATGDIWSINAAGTIGAVSAANHLGKLTVGKNLTNPVSAGLDIGTVVVDDSILVGASVTAGRHLGAWTNGITATAGTGQLLVTPVGDLSTALFGGVIAGEHINADVSANAGSLGVVYAEQDINGDVSAAGTILFVGSRNGSLTGDVDASAGHVGRVQSGTTDDDVTGNVSAGQHVFFVKADRDLTGDVLATTSVGTVWAGRHLSGNVIADGGSIYFVTAAGKFINGISTGNITSGTITAAQFVRSIVVLANDGSTGSLGTAGTPVTVTASAASIGDVSATNQIHAHFTAGGSVGTIAAPKGVTGSINAAASIVGVAADDGPIQLDVTANGVLGPVVAKYAVAGTFQAGTIVAVTSEKAGISGSLAAAGSIGDVLAGAAINAPITASAGGIGTVESGRDTAGDIVGDVSAGGSIYGVTAGIADETEYVYPSAPPQSDWYAALAAWLALPDPDPAAFPRPPRPAPPPTTQKGHLTGNVTAGDSIGWVSAEGKITGNLTAAKRLDAVWALADLTGDVTSGSGPTIVNTWGALTGNVTATGDALVFAYDTLTGNVTSTQGFAAADTWADLRGNVNGLLGAAVWAYGDVNDSTIYTALGPAALVSMGTANNTTVDAKSTSAVSVLRKYSGNVISRSGDVFASALAGMAGQLNAQNNAVASSLATIQSSIVANTGQALIEAKSFIGESITAGKSILLIVENSLSASIRSTGGDVFISAAEIGSGSSTSIISDTGRVGLEVFGNLQANVLADQGVAIWTKGSILDQGSGSVISANNGFVNITSLGTVEADVFGWNGTNVSVVTWDDLNGNISAFNPSYAYSPTTANVVVFAYGSIDGDIQADGGVAATSWNNITTDVIALGDVRLFARHDVLADINAGRHLSIIAAGDVFGDFVAGSRDNQGSALIVADSSIDASLIAAKHAAIDVLGNAKVDIIAKSGDALLSSLGYVEQSTVTANAGNATITTGGTIDSSTVTAGLDAVVTAHGDIMNLTVRSRRNADVLGDANVATTTVTAGIGGAGNAVIGALNNLPTVTVTAANAIDLLAGNTASGTNATAGLGNLNATALNDLAGAFSGKQDVNLTAHRLLNDVTVTTIGNVSLYAGGDAGSTSKATANGRNLDVTVLHDLEAQLSATGTATVFIGGKLKNKTGQTGAAVTAQGNADVLLEGALEAGVTSTAGSATVVTQGRLSPTATGAAVTGDVSAGIHATVTNLGGSVNGEVTATLGDAVVTSAEDVGGSVTAGRNVVVRAVGNVTGTPADVVEAGAHALVSALGSIDLDVTATGGNAIVAAGADVTGVVSANLNTLVVAATGGVDQTVTATHGTALVVASETVTDDVTAGLHAGVFTLDSIQGNVSATDGHAVAVATGGGIQGTVTAGRSAAVFALDDVQQNVSAGEDAIVGTLGNQIGNVSAGRDALVSAAGHLSAPVTAGRHAFVSAVGNVSAGVTATTGDALVLSFGTVNSTITAGQDAILLGLGAGDGVTATVNAGNQAFVEAFGPANLTVNAPQDAYVFTAGGTLEGTIDAGRHAAVIALGHQTAIQVDAGLDAFVFALGTLDLALTAGRDTAVIGLDQVKGTVTATSDAFVYAVGVVTTLVVNAGDYAGLIAWDMVQGPSLVSGDDGTFAWTFSSFYGDVVSEAGWAVLTAYGDVFLTSVVAETDALVFVVGNFHIASDVTAGDSTYVIALGNFEATVTAGADAVFLGEGDFNVNATAGKDVFVYALGNVRGSYDAGRDASVITFANFHARLHAGRDVGGEIYGLQHPGVWAKGNITGVIDANRNVGGYDDHTPAIFDETRYPVIFAGGTINADIYARNTSHQPTGGRISKVGAHGDIAGLFKAESAIDEVFSAGNIDAILDAPQVAGIRENDPSVITDYPLPATPDSVKPEVLADAALIHAEVLANVDAVFAATDELMAAIAALEAQVDDAVADTRAEIAQANAEAQAELEEAVQTVRKSALDAFSKRRDEHAKVFAEVRSLAEKDRNTLAADIEATRKATVKSMAAATNLLVVAEASIVRLDGALATAKARIIQRAEAVAEEYRMVFVRARIEERMRKWREEHNSALNRAARAFAGRRGDFLDQIIGTPSGQGYWHDVWETAKRLKRIEQNISWGFVKAGWILIHDTIAGPIDIQMTFQETLLLWLGFEPKPWQQISYAGQAFEKGFQNGETLGSTYRKTGLNMITFGGYGAYKSFQYGQATGDYTQFQEDLGGIGLNIVLMKVAGGRPSSRYSSARIRATNGGSILRAKSTPGWKTPLSNFFRKPTLEERIQAGLADGGMIRHNPSVRISLKEAFENGLRPRDNYWPWRGLHRWEEHHPLMQGKTFRSYWKERGFTDSDVRNTTVWLRKDIHRAIEESGYWQKELLGRIKAKEGSKGHFLTKDEVLGIVDDLLNDIGKWSP